MKFKNRIEAGFALGELLTSYNFIDPVVIALPRGGVPIATGIAEKLHVPIDILIVRKLGMPLREELALGAIAEDGSIWWNQELLKYLDYNESILNSLKKNEEKTIEMQKRLFRNNQPITNLTKKTVILTDDGLATGATMQVAILAIKKLNPKKIIVAVPVAATNSITEIRSMGIKCISLLEIQEFYGVSHWYENFHQVEDNEVIQLLKEKNKYSKKILNFPNEERSIIKTIAEKISPISNLDSLDKLIEHIGDKKIVMLGEATHGSSEFYKLRANISNRLIEDHQFSFIAAESDWPAAQKLHRYIQDGTGISSKKIMEKFHRWPTWMWANEETSSFIEHSRIAQKIGFYGLDIYSLYESIDIVINFLKTVDPFLAKIVKDRYSCFDPFINNEIAYTKSLLQFPKGCTEEVISNLESILKIHLSNKEINETLLDAKQNAKIVVNAENYYRSMLRGDEVSWNIRDSHMLETLDFIFEKNKKIGRSNKAIIWAHNTHIGDYRATNMHASGYINLGGLARINYGEDNVSLIGFGTYEGTVRAAKSWGGKEEEMLVPAANKGSFEYFFHEALKIRGIKSGYILFNKELQSSPLSSIYGHRAIGVVYDPKHENKSSYVPTSLSKRYDAFIFIDKTTALHSLSSISSGLGKIPDTWPAGM